MDIDTILEKYVTILSQKDLSFDEKVGFITGRETDASLSPENVIKTAKTIKNLVLGNLNRRLAASRVPDPVRPPKTSAAKPALTKADIEREIGALQDKMRGIDFADANAGQNLQLWGKRLATLKEKLAAWQ